MRMITLPVTKTTGSTGNCSYLSLTEREFQCINNFAEKLLPKMHAKKKCDNIFVDRYMKQLLYVWMGGKHNDMYFKSCMIVQRTLFIYIKSLISTDCAYIKGQVTIFQLGVH